MTVDKRQAAELAAGAEQEPRYAVVFRGQDGQTWVGLSAFTEIECRAEVERMQRRMPPSFAADYHIVHLEPAVGWLPFVGRGAEDDGEEVAS